MQDLGSSRPSSERLACHPSEMNVPSDRSTRANSVELPPLSQLDVEVIKNLPPDIISEMNDMYKGKLHGFLNMTNGDKGKERYPKSLVLPAVTRRSVPVRDVKLHKYEGCNDSMHLEKEKVIKGASDKQLSEVRTNDASCPRASGMVDAKSVRRLDYMPNSLSQVDFTVLQELPEDVKADLFNVLPLHRSRDPTCSTSENKCSNDGRTDDPKHPVISLLSGSSKKWTEQFRVSSCLLLNVIAEQGTDSICNKPLSSILEHMVSFLPLCPNPGTEEWNETFSCLSKLLTQYIHLKVESDIEELHKCFRLLKRFSSSSVFFLELHNSVLPVLQDSVGQHYGGTLLL